ncbi:MAG TPA: TMEM165/GDT1 family protein [Stellaceae bacterium]|nr:TMEM165/GDT1 family protein [Stellaceae bacterium]
MAAFIAAFLATLPAEILDRNEFLALLLAARFGRQIPILLGIVGAAILNHSLANLASYADLWSFYWMEPRYLRWALGVVFLAAAAGVVLPGEKWRGASWVGIFLLAFFAFALTLSSDKLRLITSSLIARAGSPSWVVAGTATAVLVAEIPAVMIGHYLGRLLPFRLGRYIAALLIAAIGVLTLLGLGTFA